MKTAMEVKDILEKYEEIGTYKGTARALGISKNTVKSYVRNCREAREGKRENIFKGKIEKIEKRTELTTKVHDYLEENKTKKKKQRYTGKKIFRMLRKKGIRTSYSTVKRIVKDWKEKYRSRETFIKQEPRVGRTAEFDWGSVWLEIGNNKLREYSCSFMVLNSVLYRFARIYSKETKLEVKDSHIKFLEEIGGVPEEIVYDNLKVVVDDCKTKKLNEKFIEFAGFYGFKIRPCNPSRGNEKGTDEETVGFVRREVFSERNKFSSVDEANEYLKEKLQEINNYSVEGREEVPAKGLETARKFLKKLPTMQYSNYELMSRHINKYSFINVYTNRYSVPDSYNKNVIMIKVYPEKIELLEEGKVIAVHKRLYGKNEYALKIEHYIETLKKKPGALPNSKVFLTLKKYLQILYRYYTKKVKEFIEILSLLKKYNEKILNKTIEKLLSQGIIPNYDILKNILEQKDIEDSYNNDFEYSRYKINIEYGHPAEFDKLLTSKEAVHV